MTARTSPFDLRLLADDLTGALDSAAAFGSGVPVCIDQVPRASHGGVVAVATPTRDVPPGELADRLAHLLDWFVSGALAFKKVDSLLRGNTFAECAHLARAGGFDGVVFAPAFPLQRRVTVAGQQFVTPAEAAAGGAWTPVGPSIVEAFGALGLACRTSAASEPPIGRTAAPMVWIPDVRSDADLAAVVRLAGSASASAPAAGRWLWCGSAGLAHAFAATSNELSRSPSTAPPLPQGSEAARPLLMLGASHHPVVRRQWQRLRDAWPQATVVRAGDAQEFAAAGSAMAQRFDVAALELSPRQELTPGQAAELLEAQLAQLVSRIHAPATLLVIGGDTLLGVCRATGVESLRTLPAARAGWGCARLVGGRWDGLTCHSRSGAFGDEADLDDMLRQVAGMR